jgi:hypothetical protein
VPCSAKSGNSIKARFETETGTQVVTCFNHHISDFKDAANVNSLQLLSLTEYFDDDDRNHIPRLLTLLFQKKAYYLLCPFVQALQKSKLNSNPIKIR